jgi:subtilisin family serine protease
VTHSRLAVACAFALLCAIGCAVPAAADAADIIMRRDAGLSATQRGAVRADAGVKFLRALRVADAELVTVPAPAQKHALAQLNANPAVLYAEPAVRFAAAARPDDPDWDLLWALENRGQPIRRGIGGTNDADVDAPEAWAVTRGAGQTTAVVDTGIDLTHPDLVGRIVPGGRSFVAGVASADDDNYPGHGTNVAGVLAATANNALGVAGVAPEAKLLPLKALDSAGSGNSTSIGEALAYAGDLGLRVVNLSASGAQFSQFVYDAIAAHPQTLYVVAAGNGEDYGNAVIGDDNDGPVGGESGPEYPCNYALANVLCVGATDYHDNVTSWSNFGSTSVDLFAPGELLRTTDAGGTYGFRQGTSLSAPVVAGEATLLASAHPSLTPASLRRLILTSVDPIPGAVGASVSGGRANAGNALAAPVRDADGDGVLDDLDNCVPGSNVDQADADRDGVGNVCDPTPRGDDVDGDGKPLLDDRCPYEAGAGADGCPVVNPPGGGGGTPRPPASTVTPAPTAIVSLKAKVSKCPKGKACTKVAKVTVKLSREAKVALRVERRVRKKGRLVWTRVRSQSLTANARGRTLTVRGKRDKPTSRYRVTAILSGKAKSVSFRV